MSTEEKSHSLFGFRRNAVLIAALRRRDYQIQREWGLWIPTGSRALRRDASRLLLHDDQRASDARVRHAHDGRPFHGFRWCGVLPPLCDVATRARNALRL
jgi:hypothetical protein